ncbi:oligosaccharide flippase family protein, partial [Sphingomonas sp.]|uniref:oligosaccharide flippase family protein n=1 Tax=Sphingomonas sp. TaxID=28214 RepID=UPI0025D59420
LAALAVGRGSALSWYVVLAPVSSLIVGLVLARRVPPIESEGEPARTLTQAADLVKLGLPFMMAGLASNAALLLVRTVLLDRRGAAELGLFAATWTISTTYVSFILQAMSTDYFPHLSAIIEDRPAANRLINDQIEVSVLLALPLLLLTVGCAPWMLHFAYSAAFVGAADLLRWQVAGDLFRIFSWPLTMSMLAAGRGRTFLLTEAGASFFYTATVFLLVDRLGLAAAGVAYVLMYAGHCSILLILTRQAHGFRLDAAVRLHALIGGACLALLTAVAFWSATLGTWIGLPAAVSAGYFSVKRLRRLNALPSRVEAMIDAIARLSRTGAAGTR